MSSDTSRSQSQLPNNKMAETLCLSAICVSLFQLSLPQPFGEKNSQHFAGLAEDLFPITLGCCCENFYPKYCFRFRFPFS